MLRFLPIILSDTSDMLLERGLKYFLVQSVRSILFLVGSLTILRGSFPDPTCLITIPILVKLGAAPFHGWFIRILSIVQIRTLTLLSTLQKLTPLLLLLHLKISY